MLTRLLPDQIASFWDIIKYSIDESLPPIVGDHPDRLNRILSSLLCNKTECWASYNKGENKITFEGIVLTKIIYDDASNTRNLLIYCLYGYDEVNKGSWLEGFKSLIKYAKSKNCNQIIAYSEHAYIVNTAKSLGADTSYTFISFNINKSVKLLNGLNMKEK